MILYYEFNGDDFEYEIDWIDVKSFLENYLKNYTLKDIVEFIVDNDGDTIEEIYYEEIKDYFELRARNAYDDERKTENDLVYDYYYDKL